MAQFESLVESHDPFKSPSKKTEPRKIERTHRRFITSSSTKLSTPATAKSVSTSSSSSDSLSVSSFELKKWQVSSSSPEKEPSDSSDGSSSNGGKKTPCVFYAVDCCADGRREEVNQDSLSTYTVLLRDVRQGRCVEMKGEDILGSLQVREETGYPLMVVKDERTVYFDAEFSPSTSHTPFSSLPSFSSSIFMTCNCASQLARTLPALYPYLWPESLTFRDKTRHAYRGGKEGGKKRLLRSHTIIGSPSVISFRSILLFGVCLRLEAFQEVLAECPAATVVLMRLLLGDEGHVKGQWGGEIATDIYII